MVGESEGDKPAQQELNFNKIKEKFFLFNYEGRKEVRKKRRKEREGKGKS